MGLNYKWAKLDDVLNAALENAPTGTICVLPDTTYVNITRVVNLVVNETKVDARSANECPAPPNQPMSKENVDALAKLPDARDKFTKLDGTAKLAEDTAKLTPTEENKDAAKEARKQATDADAEVKRLEKLAKIAK